ncbi:serine/threonine-protein kinase [Nonomuraea sp. NPDC059007]|uniref:serine/threonine-protein kinase n=1 Tax=Nonomuraea sp. NPDC059007 TaxID=3346692 RepID=UPI0036BF8563
MRLGRSVGRRYRLTNGPIRSRTSEVWLARDEQLGRDVVLKRMLSGHDSVRGFSRLRAEARALARFNHPRIVTLFDAVQVGRGRRATSWLVMEHVSGGSLNGRQAVAPEVAASVGAQVADALVCLHAEGIVHGDIKPGNVVVTGDGTVKLADFGAAYRVGGNETISPNSAISYTPDYAAPEVVLGRLERGSDVFSLGAMLHALVTGSPPERGPSGRVLLKADLGVLDEVLRAMLAREPGRRPDAAEVMRRLTEIAGDAVLPPGVNGAAGFSSDPRADSVILGAVRNHPYLTGAAAALVAALAGIASFLLPPSERDGSAQAIGPAPLIGDQRTVDPCALTEPVALGRFGATQLDRAYGNFDRCDVLVRPDGDSVVDVRVDFNHDPAAEQPGQARTVGRIGIVEQPPERDSCLRTLLPAGESDINITITAKRDDPGKAPLCAIADVATGNAVTVLNNGPLPRRTLPARSLAHQDACALLPAAALEVIPGIDANDPDIGFGSWQCGWESTTSELWLDVRFDQGPPPNSANGSATIVNGYRTILRPEADGDESCLAQLVYRTYHDQDGRAAETVNLLVTGSRSADQLCQLARRLTASAAARLPHPA